MKASPCATNLVVVLAHVVLLLRQRVGADLDPILKNTCTDEKMVMFPSGWPKSLDAHIYWFGQDNEVERATGNQSRFYDPAKKTIIFMDGFNGLYHIKSCHRMTSKCVPLAHCEPGSEFIANTWISEGWNFGIFYWDQFADEDCYYEAELKVWGHVYGTGKGDNYLKWQSYDPASKTTETRRHIGEETSVAQVCAASVRSAMPNFRGPSMHIVGFSLGAQLAAACADSFLQQTPLHPAKPTLAVLLEPAFTASIKPWSVMPLHPCSPLIDNNRRSVQWTVEAVERLWKHNVPLALYKSSWLSRAGSPSNGLMDPGTQLDILGTLVRWTPSFCGPTFNYPCQHDVIVPFYFFSMRNGSTVMENDGPSSGQCKLPGPRCSDAEMLDIATKRRKGFADGTQPLWKQVKGMQTWSQEDDVFRWDVTADPPSALPVSALRQRYSLGGYRSASVGSRVGLLSAVVALFIFASLGLVAMRRRYSREIFIDEPFIEAEE